MNPHLVVNTAVGLNWLKQAMVNGKSDGTKRVAYWRAAAHSLSCHHPLFNRRFVFNWLHMLNALVMKVLAGKTLEMFERLTSSSNEPNKSKSIVLKPVTSLTTLHVPEQWRPSSPAC